MQGEELAALHSSHSSGDRVWSLDWDAMASFWGGSFSGCPPPYKSNASHSLPEHSLPRMV